MSRETVDPDDVLVPPSTENTLTQAMALDKNTLEVIPVLSDAVGSLPDHMIYNPDLSAVESVDKKYWYVNLDDTVREMTQAEKDVVNADDLLDLKRSLVLSIDGEVERRIGEGFEYASKTFSLSGNAQIKWSGLYSARTSLDYPLVVCNIDDTDTYSIADAAEVATIYELIVDRVRTLLDQATTAKTNIMADTVVADAQAEHDAYIVSSY